MYIIGIPLSAPATLNTILRKFHLGKTRHKGSTHKKCAIVILEENAIQSVQFDLQSQVVVSAAKCPVRKQFLIFVLIVSDLGLYSESIKISIIS